MLPDRYTLSLWMLRIAASDENYSRAIWALADAIRATEAAVANAPTKPDAPWIDDFLEESLFVEEGELIENLLGAAFVVCQAHLVSVASRAVRARALGIENGKTCSKWDNNAVYSQGTVLAQSSVVDIVAINALANYFKHRSEWPTDWTQLNRQQLATANTVQALGVTQMSLGNLRRAAMAFDPGSTSEQLTAIVQAIDTWSQRVVAAC